MEKEAFIPKLKDILADVSDLHDAISLKWLDHASENNISIFNQKSVKVIELDNSVYLGSILAYGNFLTEMKEFLTLSEYDDEGLVVNARIKTQNSIMEKLYDYCHHAKEKGEVPANKCFNDLFGIRIVVDCDDISYDDIERCVDTFDNLSYVNKKFHLGVSDRDYVATHIYFKGGDNNEERNRQFRWELQIWTMAQERNNHRLHQNHRFKYRKWEMGADGNA